MASDNAAEQQEARGVQQLLQLTLSYGQDLEHKTIKKNLTASDETLFQQISAAVWTAAIEMQG